MITAAEIIDTEVNVVIKWKCPNCEYEQVTEFNLSPYRSVQDDPVDEACGNCKEYFTLQV